MKEWGEELFSDMKDVAELLDKAYKSDKYVKALLIEGKKLSDVTLTPSAKIVDIVVGQAESLTEFSLSIAKDYRNMALSSDYQFYSEAYFIEQKDISHQKQFEIEQADNVNFDDFIADYFQ